ncbi:hypothetical protein HMPREF1055_00911 [Bacteroides fragilis CL07T00C01]|jgi:hypothetical protein|uniref:Uncharacterized protein n=1 Tax=Bacteroides fragilis CL07T12C05 TaxID=997883 RepID=A0A0E2AP65_BACFG|nr:hypothetical protein [Bacteroides fragilis]EIK40175.1 hypothetical protein HMPREF1055_00911 [Bacteroides fragilis CL07T00C01]EIY96124.1 hypothetical protein HMPREF1056_02012 [Bacteroides fragilis CL07T12C05]MCE9139282.1 hypothetical protein [Bacteroides fragilis]MCI7229384.1 hypothetical protein [Bacteroides fragilis]
MKTAREIQNGNKNSPNLPLQNLIVWVFRIFPSVLCWSLYGGNFLGWLIGLWLAGKIIAGIIRFVWGCLITILSIAVIIGFIIWIATL